MRSELLSLSKAQAEEIVDIQLPVDMDESKGGGMFLFLHFGNFFLLPNNNSTFLIEFTRSLNSFGSKLAK